MSCGQRHEVSYDDGRKVRRVWGIVDRSGQRLAKPAILFDSGRIDTLPIRLHNVGAAIQKYHNEVRRCFEANSLENSSCCRQYLSIEETEFTRPSSSFGFRGLSESQ